MCLTCACMDAHLEVGENNIRYEDLKQAAVILASFLYKAADREEPLPRMPLPTRPSVTDPFGYEDPDEEEDTEE